MKPSFQGRSLLHLAIAGASLAVLACGGRSTSTDQGDTPQPEADAGVAGADGGADAGVENCGTLHENNCPSGLSCMGAPTCGAVWQCRDEYPGCSAAGPFSVCGCDGIVGSAAAGCPGRHAWRLEGYPPAEPGSPCDGSLTTPPAIVDVRVVGTGLDAFETLLLDLGRGRARLALSVSNGAATGYFRGMEHFSGLYLLAVFADAAEQNVCVDGVDRFGLVYQARFDALSLEVTFEFESDDLTATCADMIR